MKHLLHFAAAAAVAASLSAQGTFIVPDVVGNGTTEANSSSSYPWNRTTADCRVQYNYDTTHFTSQQISFPLLVNRMRWRANGGGASAGGQWANGIIQLSTAAVDYTAMTTSFAGNHGVDLATVYSGAIACAAAAGTTPNTWYIDVPLQTPFLYDPTSGNDFLVDVGVDSTSWTGGGSTALDVEFVAGTTRVTRMYDLTSYQATTGTVQADVGPTMEIAFNPASGLYPGFTADVTSGNSPLTVNFTDQSFSSDPAGVIAWIWDVDGDGTPDYSTQNVTHTYNTCGVYDVELSVLDGMHGLVSLRKTAYIDVDPVSADFTTSSLGNNQVQFTDTSTGGVNGWMWDFDGDGTIDSTVQNPVHTYPQVGVYNASLTATNGCNTGTVTQSVPTFGLLCTTFAGGNGLGANAGNYFDLTVTAPNGILVTGLDVSALNAATGNVDVWITPRTYVGNETNQAAWTLVSSTPNVTLTGGYGSQDFVDVPDFFLPPGTQGIYIQTAGGVAYTNGNQAFSNGDLSLNLGASSTNFGSPIASRIWNGCIYYDTNPQGVYFKYADGCAGTAGVATLTAAAGSAPKIGTTLTVDVGNMPVANVAIMIFGINNQTWNGTPLPANLRPFGAPNCFGHLAPESTSLVIGAGGTGQWNLPIPNVAAFVGTPFYNQALIIDPGVNGLGAVVSDAAAGVVGQ